MKIADTVFAIRGAPSIDLIRWEEPYRAFFGGGRPDVTIEAVWGELPDLGLEDKDKVFDSSVTWALYRKNQKNIIVLKRPGAELRPYRIAVFDQDFKKGTVYDAVKASGRSRGRPPSNPMDYPLLEVLMVCLLSRGRGLMVHACGISADGRGYLFAGNSGQGKTTMAELWKRDGVVLNDDRVILRPGKDDFLMYGTPWHGADKGVSPQSVPVEKILFLQHGEFHKTTRLSEPEASSRLLSCSMLPIWDSDGLRFTLDFCAESVRTIPSYRLEFAPRRDIVDYVRRLD